jgi:hypothetical protein
MLWACAWVPGDRGGQSNNERKQGGHQVHHLLLNEVLPVDKHRQQRGNALDLLPAQHMCDQDAFLTNRQQLAPNYRPYVQ